MTSTARYHTCIRRLLLIGLGITVFGLATAAANRLHPTEGLRVDYYANTTWTPPVARTNRDTEVSVDRIQADWEGAPPATFSAIWNGWLSIPLDGEYTFAVAADGPCALAIDGARVSDSGSPPSPVHLTRGAHHLFLQYAHAQSPSRIDLTWAPGTAAQVPIPTSRLFLRKPRTDLPITTEALLPGALALAEWAWIGWLLLVCGACLAIAARRYGQRVRLTDYWRPLGAILLGSLALNVLGIWWGLPGEWVAGELTHPDVIKGLAQHFSHGWMDVYPPLQFYLDAIVLSPILLLWHWGRLEFGDANTLAMLLTRSISIAQAVVIVAATFAAARIVFGRRAGLFAAAVIAVTATFVYYAKTANVDVPYVCWFAVSLVFYLRALTRGATRDFVLFGVFAALSVCTKDQAYGLYALMPVVLVVEIWRARRGAGRGPALVGALLDPRMWIGGAAAAATFAIVHNLAFNSQGFLAHARFIAGSGSVPYRVFEPTISGHLALLVATLDLTQQSLGWPVTVAATAGLAIALARPSTRRAAVWLIMPAVSYYLSFINVILYNYDRFMLPVCVLLAIFGGLAFDAWLVSMREARAARGMVAAAFTYSVLYAGAVDYLMIRDSRYAAARWLEAHVRAGDVIGVSGNPEYNPVLDRFARANVASLDQLHKVRPAYVVINADYLSAVSLDTDWGQFAAALRDHRTGCALAAQFRTPLPWSWLPGNRRDLVGPRDETIVLTTLRNINPTIDIYTCGAASVASAQPASR